MTPSFADLLRSAVIDPGSISAAYSQFHNYSLGNQLLAWGQCVSRGIQPGPLATFPKWKELGRHVRRGEKAITLCQPVTITRANEADTDEAEVYTRFVYRNSWFVLAQTEGEAVEPQPLPKWNRQKACSVLNVDEIAFDLTDGNCQGFARGRSISISPLAALPAKTTFHELAHVVLGHTGEGVELNDGELTPRNLRECEAESVALLCLAALEFPGVEFCRGYIQSWWGHANPIPEKSAQRILKAADQILKAGVTTEAAS